MEFVAVSDEAGPVEGCLARTALFGRADGTPLPVTFAVDDGLAPWLTDRTDPWLVLGVAAAFALGEDYVHPGPVSPKLLRHLRALTRQWQQWYPARRPVEISAVAADVPETAPAPRGDLVACFFTAGVDSSFTLAERDAEIDVLLNVAFKFAGDWGFMAHRSQRRAEDLGKISITVGTDVLTWFPEFSDAWSYLTHGAALATVGHLFELRIGRAIISSSHDFGHLIPWGSHPLTDPLLASEAVEVEHYGTEFSRLDKTLRIAAAPRALKWLSVCGLPPDQKAGRPNCSSCQKCLRTMAAIDLAGIDRQQASSFVWDDYSLDRVRAVALRQPNERLFFRELVAGARARTR